MDNKEKFIEFYRASKERIEKKIELYNRELVKEDDPLLGTFFKDLADLNSGGKLLRGVFVDIGYMLADGDVPGYGDGMSMAYEMFQTGVLIHDDIIDHAGMRRGKDTIHKRYAASLAARGISDAAGDTPESAAICAGDLGLYLANRIIADEYSGNEKLASVISYFNGVVIDTIRGELLDVILPCEIKDENLPEADVNEMLSSSVRKIYYLKTARYSVIGPIHSGMILGGMPEEKMALIDEYAKWLGIAFQVKDDILGIFGEQDAIGKDVGADIKEAKLTILYEYVRTRDKEALRELSRYYGDPGTGPEETRKVREIFEKSGALDHAVRYMEECFGKAESALAACGFLDDEKKAILLGIRDYFRDRKK